MIKYVDTSIFGVALTIIIYSISNYAYKKTKNVLFNPTAVSTIFIICVLKIFNIGIENYEKGGQIINFFIGPATVILSILIYKKREILKESFISILIGIFMGALAGILSIIIMGKIFALEEIMVLSLIPKSTTSAISIDLSRQIKGNPSMTVAFTMITGTLGNVFGVSILNAFKINNKKARGLALGTSSHVVGTAKAMELGQTEGAVSSLAIGISGIVTVFLAPIIIKFII